MNKSHAKSFDKLEETREALLDRLQTKSHEDISTQKNNKWSPLEQCYHLYLAESLSRKYCEKKLSFNPDLQDAGIMSALRLLALKASEVVPIKLKASDYVNEKVFPSDLTLDKVRLTWQKDREELKSFLDNLDPSLVQKAIYKQPTVGRLSIGGMLEFFQFHHDRHSNHIKKQYGI